MTGEQHDGTVGAAPHHTQPGFRGPEGVGLAGVPWRPDAQDRATVNLPRPGDSVETLGAGDTLDDAGVFGPSGIRTKIE